ncbi:EF-hand domain-containing protein [Ascoidea rubescens DSM 1968]|uniref:EF-hand n=1 Tax=Ascoidea rubescens DSM 1968 TaxID=1344418 RepID=A0A1D2VKV2_9ASCO|nr:EF-hand [Ascoidea rubescens DSM 1968]ODV62215.1 EF-hand [Ascoidea rubescens DSM 1968]
MVQKTSDVEKLEIQLKKLFDTVDVNKSGKLTEKELSRALYNTDYSKFEISTISLMIKLFDKDGSGDVDFKEFYNLWNYITHWRKVFQIYDKDKSNTITFSEYQETLKSFGYRLSIDTSLYIFRKFSNNNSSSAFEMKFDLYVESLIWLLKCTNSFKKYDSEGSGIGVIPFEKFVLEVLSFR